LGANEDVTPDRNTANDGRVRSDARLPARELAGTALFFLAESMRIEIVREDGVGAYENTFRNTMLSKC